MMINQTRLMFILNTSCPYTFIPLGQLLSSHPFLVHSLCPDIMFHLSLFVLIVDK